MNNLEKAKDNLEEKDIWSVIENETLYVLINDVKLELSIDEIRHYQKIIVGLMETERLMQEIDEYFEV
jgi:hypothetical protein